MRKIVEGFVHRPGVHCDSSALRDVFEYHGFKFSEAVIFGLGSGLGFIYWETKRAPYPFVGGRGKDLDKNLCENLGVKLQVHKTSSKSRAYKTMRELIVNDTPVMIHVDMPYLKYLGLPEEAHFGAHSVVIAGIDEEGRVVYIADTAFDGLQRASLKELEEARSSRFKPFPPENKWFTFEFPEELTPLDRAIRNAIKKTVESMLAPPIRNLGVRGISRFANRIVGWPKRIPAEKLPLLYEVTYGFIEEYGTGGGCFRHLYSRFLKEAGESLGSEQVSKMGDDYHRIGEMWTRVARLIGDVPNTETLEGEVRELLLKIARAEERALHALKDVMSEI